MSRLRILWLSETADNKAKRENKKIADTIKNTIKELGEVEVYSAITKEKIAVIKNKETIYNYWGSVDIELDDFVQDKDLKANGVIQEIVYGSTYDKKNRLVTCIEKIIV